ncbi:DUF3048 domain-containing protein [Solicola sp. PLA-1-18]|uniref:DUF3048 domain-containing protein n=1 Tax=Solicola sp. PLA-1-18 TaxID=3380532 RepID=UPI003B7F6F17
MRLAPVVPALAVLALVAGCSGSGIPVASSSSAPVATTPAAVSAPSPLTGLPMDRLPQHPVYVVKIDNTQAARPQVGVIHADVVVEELVEGGLTRLAAFFYSKTPDAIGPVRSMRATDVAIARPAEATVIASGGAPATIALVERAGIPVISEDTGQLDVLVKAADRRAPYNRILDLRPVADAADDVPSVKPYLPFGAADSQPGTDPATAFTVRFGAGAGTRWALQGTRYRRQNGLAAPGKEFKADNVLVLKAPVQSAGYADVAGNDVPETVLEGKGEATLFHDGQMVEGRWRKSSASSRLRLETTDGAPLEVPAGRTWIELVPESTGSVSVTDPAQ